MLDANQLISMAESLPIDLKTRLIESLLNSLQPVQPEIDMLWTVEAERRIKEIKSGKVQSISGEEVLQSIRNRLSR